MSDNYTLSYQYNTDGIHTQIGSNTIRADDVGGVKVPVVKLAYGAAGVETALVSPAAPLPVQHGDGTNTMPAGDAATRPIFVTPACSTTGGATAYTKVATADTNSASVKGSAGTFLGIHVGNAAAYAVYVKLYNKATAPTVGTDTPVAVFTVPPAGSINFAPPSGLAFATGIGIGITKDAANADTTALTAKDCTVVLAYK